jgi:hypothetical protein
MVVGAHLRVRPMVRMAVRSRRLHAVSVEIAYSGGPFHYESRPIHSSTTTFVDTDWAHWAQFDVGWETRAESGFSLRVAPGVAGALNKADQVCSSQDFPVSGPPEPKVCDHYDRISALLVLTADVGFSF